MCVELPKGEREPAGLNLDHNEFTWFRWGEADIELSHAVLVIDLRRRSAIAWDVEGLLRSVTLECALVASIDQEMFSQGEALTMMVHD